MPSRKIIGGSTVTDDDPLQVQVMRAAMTELGTKGVPTAIAVGTVAVPLVAAATRMGVVLQNVGTQAVYLGKDSTVTTGAGLLLAAGGGFLQDTLSADAWWGIAAAAGGDVRVTVVT